MMSGVLSLPAKELTTIPLERRISIIPRPSESNAN